MASPTEVERMFDQESEMLEEIPLPNLPKDERERREQWLKLPRATRIAVRRLHRQFGHVPNRVLVQILRASNAKADFIKAARTLRCEGCDAVHPKPQTQKVTLPRSLSFKTQSELTSTILCVLDGRSRYVFSPSHCDQSRWKPNYIGNV